MVNTSNIGAHHQHVRKRIYNNLEEYPHPDKLKHFVDILVFVASIGGFILTIPQILLVWVNHQTAGVSIISWSAYSVIAVIWILYGSIHKEKTIIILSIVSCFINLLVVIGVLLFR